MTRNKIIGLVILIGSILIAIFSAGFYSNSLQSPREANTSQSTDPTVVKTNPKELDQSTILPNQTLEIFFSHPLENVPETRWSVEPQADYKAELSDDKKTLKLIPNSPLNLGQSYTLFIKAETKIEGKKTLDKEYQFHFKTIDFKGA